MLRKLRLESIIENNQDLLDFHDLTKAEEKKARAQIKKAKEALKRLEAE